MEQAQAAHWVIILPLISADTVAQPEFERVTRARTRLPSPPTHKSENRNSEGAEIYP